MNIKDDYVYIEHMLECINRIEEYITVEHATPKELFFKTHIVQDAVIRNLQVMAESSQRIRDNIKANYPEIPWKQISGFRNILAHDYLGIDLAVIWSVLELELPNLKKSLILMQKT